MEVEELKQLAEIRANLLMEYIIQILSDCQKVSANIGINPAKINDKKMCTFDIIVPERKFERYLNTGIETKYCDYLNEQIFRKLIENFMDSETIDITEFHNISYGFVVEITWGVINVTNDVDSSIVICFSCKGEKFNEQVSNYNKILDQYIETHNMEKNKLK